MQDDKFGVFCPCLMAIVKSPRYFRVSLPAAALGIATWKPLKGRAMLNRKGVEQDAGFTEGQKGSTTTSWFKPRGFGGVCSRGSAQAAPADLASRRNRKGQSKKSTRVARERIWGKKQQASTRVELLRDKAEIWGGSAPQESPKSLRAPKTQQERYSLGGQCHGRAKPWAKGLWRRRDDDELPFWRESWGDRSYPRSESWL